MYSNNPYKLSQQPKKQTIKQFVKDYQLATDRSKEYVTLKRLRPVIYIEPDKYAEMRIYQKYNLLSGYVRRVYHLTPIIMTLLTDGEKALLERDRLYIDRFTDDYYNFYRKVLYLNDDTYMS